MTGPIQSQSNDYTQILNDLNSDAELIDKPNWFKRMIAGIGDTISTWLNAAANNNLLRTAFTRRAVQDLLELIDYFLAPASTSSGTLLFYVNPAASLPITFNPSDMIALFPGSSDKTQKRFEARVSVTMNAFSETFTANAGTDLLTVARDYLTGERVRVSSAGTLPAPLTAATNYYAIRVSATTIRLATTVANAFSNTFIDITTAGTGIHTITLHSFRASAFQQTSKANFITVGTSNGTDIFQRYELPDLSIIQETVEVVINGVGWTRVSSLISSISTDKHYLLRYRTNGIAYVEFGNGIYGQIPGAFDVTAKYATGGGSISNISGLNSITSYLAAHVSIQGVTNATKMTGGGEAESIDSGKVVGPLLLKSKDRFVTTEDGRALALNFGGLTLVKVNRNAYGAGTCQVLAVPKGGGFMSTPFKGLLDTFLTDRTILESIDVRVEDHTLLTQNLNITVTLQTGFILANVSPFVSLAARLSTTDVGQEVKDIFSENGILEAISFINDKWGYSFTSANSVEITNIINRFKATDFGLDIQLSDILSVIDQITGVDFVTINSPSFPIVVGDNELTVDGTMTVV